MKKIIVLIGAAAGDSNNSHIKPRRTNKYLWIIQKLHQHSKLHDYSRNSKTIPNSSKNFLHSYLFVDKFLSKRYPFGVPRFFNGGILSVCKWGLRFLSIHPPPRPNRVVKYNDRSLGQVKVPCTLSTTLPSTNAVVFYGKKKCMMGKPDGY